MRSDVWIYKLTIYLYNKNTLEYVEIVGSEPKSMILDIEGRSTIECFSPFIHCNDVVS